MGLRTIINQPNKNTDVGESGVGSTGRWALQVGVGSTGNFWGRTGNVWRRPFLRSLEIWCILHAPMKYINSTPCVLFFFLSLLPHTRIFTWCGPTLTKTRLRFWNLRLYISGCMPTLINISVLTVITPISVDFKTWTTYCNPLKPTWTLVRWT